MFGPYLEQSIDQIVPSGTTHIGFIAGDKSGRFAIAKPKKNSWGTTATFAKERLLLDERPSQTLRRCLAQYNSQHIESIYPVPHVWNTPTSVSFFFTGLLWDGEESWETEKGWFEWALSEHITELLNASKNESSKRRDLGVLDAASTMCLSPHHRVLLMVRELHLMGFERLRAVPYDYPIAWRCPVVPASWTFREHGGCFRDPRANLALIPALRPNESNPLRYCYSSAQTQRPFDINGVAFATPRELAERFIQEFPEIAICGWGPDNDYVRWFDQVLEGIKPYHLFSAFGEYNGPVDYLYCSNGTRIPLPPPGHTAENEFETFTQRFTQEKEF